MIHEKTCYIIDCDNCKIQYDEKTEDKETLSRIVKAVGWYTDLGNNRFFCPKCWSPIDPENPEGAIVINSERMDYFL